jgi:hypothetical protein
MKTLALAALAALLLSGCASPILTPQALRARCWSASDPNCFPLCDTYREVAENTKYAGKKECRAACIASHQRLASENAINRCEPANAQGMDLCTQYCNQNFSE